MIKNSMLDIFATSMESTRGQKIGNYMHDFEVYR